VKQTANTFDRRAFITARADARGNGHPALFHSRGERAGRRFIELFTANIRNRNTRLAYARAAKR